MSEAQLLCDAAMLLGRKTEAEAEALIEQMRHGANEARALRTTLDGEQP